jgi:hypothetical protein
VALGQMGTMPKGYSSLLAAESPFQGLRPTFGAASGMPCKDAVDQRVEEGAVAGEAVPDGAGGLDVYDPVPVPEGGATAPLRRR